MPSKSRRKRGKYSPPIKKRKGKRTPVLTTAEQPVATQTYEPATPPPVAAPAASVPTPISTPAAVKHPYITGELRRIGIIAGIMLAVLVILSFVLP